MRPSSVPLHVPLHVLVPSQLLTLSAALLGLVLAFRAPLQELPTWAVLPATLVAYAAGMVLARRVSEQHRRQGV
jgi:hypothetical protein